MWIPAFELRFDMLGPPYQKGTSPHIILHECKHDWGRNLVFQDPQVNQMKQLTAKYSPPAALVGGVKHSQSRYVPEQTLI